MPLGLIGGGLGAIVLLVVITKLVKAWNAPKVAEEERLALEAKAKAQDEKRDDKAARRQDRLDRKTPKP